MTYLRSDRQVRTASTRTSRRVAAAATVVLVGSSLVALAGPAAAAATPAVHINFQPATAPVPAGYAVDSGAAFNGTSGWQAVDGTPLGLSANTRDRNSSASPDQRYDTFIHMQAPTGSGSTTPGVWQYALPSGAYNVTVAVGEASAIDSVDEITAEPGSANAVAIIDHYRPTAAAHWSTVTKQVTVTDGFLTLDPTGGANTKMNFVDIVPVGSGAAQVSVSSPVDSVLGLTRSRLIFSTVAQAATPAQSFTVSNTGGTALTVSNLAVTGADASSFALAPGQPTSLTIAPNATAQVALVFRPAANSVCASSSSPISTSERYASLTFNTTDPDVPSGSADLAGMNDCGNEGSNEPVLDQMASLLGYTDVTSNGTGWARRTLGPLRPLPNSDQVQVPYFVRADAGKAVTLTPVAHYSGRTTSPFGRTGWYAKGAAVTTPCSSTCNQLFSFAADSAAPGPYTQNQKMLPTVNGTTTFTPSGAFGIYNGDGSDVNFTDDGLNTLHTSGGADITPAHYGKGFRVFPAYGPGHVVIPNTWILATDVTRVPSYKNNDFQDAVFLLTNAAAETVPAAAPGSAALVHDLTAGGTVGSQCQVTGFDGVLPNSAGTQCNAANIAYRSTGLALTSTPGEMGNRTNSQQNALFDTFDASRTSFTVSARVVGPLPSLTDNYQQVAAFFGADQDNYVKIEVEHNGQGADPHVTMFYEQGGSGAGIATVSVPALTTAKTVDFIIKGNSSASDAIAPNVDTNKVRGYPLDQVSVYYSINGGTAVQIGTTQRPTDVMRWFSVAAKAGILVSGGGAPTPITATFSRFTITT